MSFQRCSGFTINGGSFTNANVRIVRNHQVKKTRAREKRSIWDDYNHVRPGDVHLEKSIGVTTVGRVYPLDPKDEEGRKQYRLWRDVDAQRSFSIARLWEGNRIRKTKNTTEELFLYITYDGPDALQAFKQDFDQFAHVRNTNIAQLFGYNDNEHGLPALIFYDALIPLGHIIIESNWFSPILYLYFAHQFGRMQSDISVGPLLLGELWVDPRTGALQRGPYIELPSFGHWRLSGPSDRDDITPGNTHSRTHLPIQTYTDTNTVFEYLTKTSKTQTILKGIHLSSGVSIQNLADELEQDIPVLSYLPGAVYNQYSRDVVARLSGARERWRYGFLGVQGRIPDAMRESWVVMLDGSVRFTITTTDIRDLQWIDLQYMICPLGEWGILGDSWLPQAHSVFSQLGIHEDAQKDYAVLNGFCLRLTRASLHDEPIISQKVYLFIPPIPRPSDGEDVWRSWAESEKYFWALDERPSELELVRPCSGLPSFTSTVAVRHINWLPSHYDAIKKLHISKGLDSTTTGFAISLGFPVLEVIGDDNRFENLEESQLQLQGDERKPQDLGKTGKDQENRRPLSRILGSTMYMTDQASECNLNMPGSYPASASATDCVGTFGFYCKRVVEGLLVFFLGFLVFVLSM